MGALGDESQLIVALSTTIFVNNAFILMYTDTDWVGFEFIY